MSCNGNSPCSCGCCAGTSVQTPQGESNAPGLPAIAYRTGTWASFRESMLARLSSSDYPALAGLKTRESDDFSIALLDSASVMLDILTFYQERLANESYLRTATQPASLAWLSRLIGYQPSPGVSASVLLAFTLKATSGQPANPNSTAITIPAGTQAQSIPAQGQTPQSFETSADILAKPDWNALPVQTGAPWTPKSGQTGVYLAGISTQLQPGDALLIVGDERLTTLSSEQWDIRLVTSVQPDIVNQRTWVQWAEGLGPQPASKNPIFYALRQRASLFGFNAINPLMLAKKTLAALTSAKLVTTANPPDWDFGTDNSTGDSLAANKIVDLDAVYSKLSKGGWVALIRPDGNNSRSPAGFVSLFQLESVTSISRSDYSIAAKITRVTTDVSGLSEYYTQTRSTSVLAQSEALAAAEQPLDHPLYGTFLDLEVLRPDLTGVSAVAITGKSQKIALNLPGPATPGPQFVPNDNPSSPVTLKQGDILTILQPPHQLLNPDGSVPCWSDSATLVTLSVSDSAGRTGTVASQMSYFRLTPTVAADPVAQESALVAQVLQVEMPFPHTRILLQNPLLNCYDRSVTTVNANVAAATAGASVTELLGNGSAATPNQQFTLKQSPLTYTQAATPTGSVSSLKVTANGAQWSLVPNLYQQPPTAQVLAATNLPGGIGVVQSGDNVEGATLPTGQNNIQAAYRVGIGAGGNVAAGAITTIVSRPLGVSGVINPLPATGGQDPQSVSDVRANAPLSVLTLGRAVSITDYQNLAATFAGIVKASALWIANGPNRGVFITVAAAGGAYLPPGNSTLASLVTALRNYGNPNVAIYTQSFYETTFGLTAYIAYDPRYDSNAVEAAVLALLQQTYSFSSRGFGQGVSSDEIAALIQGVAGVIAVNVTSVATIASSNAGDIAGAGYSVTAYNAWRAAALPAPLPRPCAGSGGICPYIPAATAGALPYAAEILVLDPNPANVVLKAMS